ncbi:putative F-box domain, leucine-rich repeat domain superfamily, F-box-like domain superfamily [Arabidopsis thaliana]
MENLNNRHEGTKNITDLPDDLLVKILSPLPIKEVVATSVLSKRWRCVWKQALKLEL